MHIIVDGEESERMQRGKNTCGEARDWNRVLKRGKR